MWHSDFTLTLQRFRFHMFSGSDLFGDIRPAHAAGSDAMSEETVLVEMCPHCQGEHVYRLNVERAVRLRVPSLSKKREQPSSVKVTQVFVCPLKNQQYEVSFYLQDRSSDRIRAVSVIGLVEESP
jgi:hypothetical protein